MSSNVNGTKLSLKVMINKQKTKVLFAEANTDFVDVLLSFLTLPLGKVVTILQKNSGEEAEAIGSLNTLYTGLCDLNDNYFRGGAKEMLVNPRSSLGAECRKLALNITDCQPNQYFCCPNAEHYWISMYSDIATCDSCGCLLNREIRVAECLDGGAFTTEPLSFVITDDLSVAPIMSGIIQTLRKLGITDTQGAEVKSFSFDLNAIRDLLKFSLTSATSLTDMIVKKTRTSSTVANPEPGILVHHHNQNEDAKSRKIVFKVHLQKSTNRFLFAEATDEFVELLFSFLTIPLGGVEFLLGGKTGLKNIDNLYRIVSDGIDEKCFMTPDTKSRLINPKLPHGYISKSQFLPLCEDAPPELYYEHKLNKQSRAGPDILGALGEKKKWCPSSFLFPFV